MATYDRQRLNAQRDIKEMLEAYERMVPAFEAMREALLQAPRPISPVELARVRERGNTEALDLATEYERWYATFYPTSRCAALALAEKVKP